MGPRSTACYCVKMLCPCSSGGVGLPGKSFLSASLNFTAVSEVVFHMGFLKGNVFVWVPLQGVPGNTP